jgi:hypothetical protein
MRPTFALLGVPVTLRPTALLAGIASAAVVAAFSRERRVELGLGAGLLWYSGDCVHVVGHIISSRAVDAPMDAVDVHLYPMSVYHSDAVSPRQHIGRAIGGVAASLLAALVWSALARLIPNPLGRQLARVAALQNALLFMLSMAPVPMVDGGVIYANLRKL